MFSKKPNPNFKKKIKIMTLNQKKKKKKLSSHAQSTGDEDSLFKKLLLISEFSKQKNNLSIPSIKTPK